MVTISNADQVMAFVRTQLERMARERKIGKAGRPTKTQGAASTGTRAPVSRRSRLEAMRGHFGTTEREFDRAIVGALLSYEFGEDVVRDPRFQPLVDRTTAILRADPDLAEMFTNLRKDLLG